jgi:hypothetical protein
MGNLLNRFLANIKDKIKPSDPWLGDQPGVPVESSQTSKSELGNHGVFSRLDCPSNGTF